MPPRPVYFLDAMPFLIVTGKERARAIAGQTSMSGQVAEYFTPSTPMRRGCRRTMGILVTIPRLFLSRRHYRAISTYELHSRHYHTRK